MISDTEQMPWPTFQDWWDLYDHKADRKKCEKKWGKLSQVDKEKAMQHTERYVATTFTDGTYPSRRHPSTYLNNENWHDEALIRPITPNRANGSGQSSSEKKREIIQSIVDKSRNDGPDLDTSDIF
jgi:hypothetical protein